MIPEDKSIQGLRLSVELCSLFAKDDSEHAKIELANIMKRYFHSWETIVLYGNSTDGFRVFKSGTARAKYFDGNYFLNGLNIGRNPSGISFFGPWTFPKTKKALPYWIAFNLYRAEASSAYIIMGRKKKWDDVQENTVLAEIGQVIAPIIEVRTRKRRAEEREMKTESLLRREQNRMATLINTSPDMIYASNRNDEIININNSGAAFLGFASVEDVIGEKISGFVGPKKTRTALLKEVKKNGNVNNYDITYVDLGGKPKYCQESTTVIKNSKGGILEYQGIVTDVSKHIEREEELKKANQELAMTNSKLKQTQLLMIQQDKLASIGQLAAGVAHEINNPLSFLKSNHGAIKRYLRTIEETVNRLGSDPALKKEPLLEELLSLDSIFRDMEEISAESDDGYERIITIVKNLTTFSRSDGDRDFELYDLNQGIITTLAVADNQIKQVAEVREHLGSIPLIEAKGGEINQVILNILINSAHSIAGQNRKEKGLITISTKKSGRFVSLSIKDDGPGIPEEIKTKIFDPFFTTKDPGKGTGLGLSISFRIVQTVHHGRIWFESEAGQGTTFFVMLPIRNPGEK